MANIAQQEKDERPAKMLHIWIPDDVHKRTKSAAALAGLTLGDFVIQILHSAVMPQELPTRRAS